MMRHTAFLSLAALAVMALPAFAQRGEPFRAQVRGSGDSGKCTIEVRVDDVAEVEVRGDTGFLRTLQGQPASWVRFVCNAPFPTGGMQEFRFRGIDGRGRVELRRDPRENRGAAVIYIVDNKGGTEGYTFDLEWKGGYLGSGGGGGNRPNRPGNSGSGGFFGGNSGSSSGTGGFFGGDSQSNSVRACQDAIAERLRRDNYSNPNFGSAALSDRPGKRDWIAGEGRARRSGSNVDFEYACRMDLDRAQVREVDLRMR
ncbi:MAG TPA: hypothetical protein VFB63_21855 [Bryobacteraceae bacterium]|nr:hypothetical protein [Bryobacteraceae bacterium]